MNNKVLFHGLIIAVLGSLLLSQGCNFGGPYYIGVRPTHEITRNCELGEDHIVLCKDSLVIVSIRSDHDGPHDFRSDAVDVSIGVCNLSDSRLLFGRNSVVLHNRELARPEPLDDHYLKSMPDLVDPDSCCSIAYFVCNTLPMRNWQREQWHRGKSQVRVDHIIDKVLCQLRFKDFVSQAETVMDFWFVKRDLIDKLEFVTGHGHVFGDFDLKFEVAEKDQSESSPNVQYSLVLRSKYKPRKDKDLFPGEAVWDTANVYLHAYTLQIINAETETEVSKLEFNPPDDNLAGEFSVDFELPMDMTRVQLRCYFSVRDKEDDSPLITEYIDLNLLLLSKGLMATLQPRPDLNLSKK